MTSRSLKSHPITLRNTLRILCSGPSLLSIAMLVSTATPSQGGVRDLFSKSDSASKSTSVARTPKGRSGVNAATVSRSAKKPNSHLLAQADAPLDRLRQRNAEQRFRDSIDEEEAFPNDVNPQSAAPSRRQAATSVADEGENQGVTEPGQLRPSEGRLAALPDDGPSEQALPEPVTSPSSLKKIGQIQPFFDYHPQTALKSEMCWDLCPRPDGLPCKPDENGLVPECPVEFKLSEAPYSPRPMSDCLYQWQASDLWHNPLYFEDPSLERYGHVHYECVQPFVSAARFSVQLVGLPYQMTIDPACKKMYNLGYYRPGECAPKKYYRVPWNTHAAINETAFWTGMFYIFP